MELMFIYLKGDKVKDQFKTKTIWFLFRVMKYATVLRLYRLKFVLVYR